VLFAIVCTLRVKEWSQKRRSRRPGFGMSSKVCMRWNGMGWMYEVWGGGEEGGEGGCVGYGRKQVVNEVGGPSMGGGEKVVVSREEKCLEVMRLVRV